MNLEEIRVLGAFVFFQIIMWAPACLLHYWSVSRSRIEAPGWLRKIFGDFRRHGSLVVQAVMIQSVVYLTMLVVVWIVLKSDLTRQRALLLWLSQFAMMAVAVGLGRMIGSRLQR
jgi:hypothetical protein